ncbi:hypothetical protein CDD81_5879 [Ophiocordyceps australis]|uniref:Clock-controlled pheromone ccg-4 n=1 Tax=Ophiocordyceps australis TaxID=1399860 RepID=A0A2C5YDF3_9HYPO|nr:hypothetical protein CDD81_5879 [Ophiocordyceps australis]
MKPIVALASLLALGAGAISTTEEQECTKVGNPCWKVERVIEAFAQSATPGPDGLSNITAADQAALAQLGQVISQATSNPQGFLQSLGLGSGGEQQVEKREALPSPRCWNRAGFFCWKARRDVEQVEQAAQETQVEKRSPHCWNRAGFSCWKARRQVEQIDEESHAEKRSPRCWQRAGFSCGKPPQDAQGEAETEASAQLDKRSCWRVGGCHKAKRSATAVIEALGSDEEQDVSKQEASDSCWAQGALCSKVSQDVDAIRNALRVIAAEQ